MEHVDVRQRPAGPLQPMKQKPGLEQRRVERLAVEAHEGAGAPQLASHRFEERPPSTNRVAGTARDERAVGLEPRAPDEERQRPGSAAQLRRLEVEEEKRRPRRGPVREERRIVRSEVETFCGVTDPLAPVARRRLHAAVDDETAGVPGAAQGALEDGERARVVGWVALVR
jgi:hypothetical protein